ncbi:MAG: 1,4-dihydroxy-2-naphthoate octaprenyltransferase [bacterium]|jgi:1,4-dihydroxy-2-naphthoate octaprenyltransferase|nr:1,4-dihydroxy-2-naphthoate octaprenyltransferase [candidate division KSB1 bacterium]MDH7558692.1 1,4-dihydroxy-2-naphthoate octaprenyltransferase [bacterium]
MRGKFGAFLAELRAPFFTASILPVVLGTTIAWVREEVCDRLLFGLALLGGVLLHAGTNVINDYFDHLTGADERNCDFVRPFTGGSRLIQSGRLTPKEVLGEAIVLYALACLIGLYLLFRVGYGVLVLGGIGLLSGFFYTFPPLALVSCGLGELAIGLNFGTLMTLGAYYVQTRHTAWEPVVASLPLAVLIAAVVFINQFQDADADATVGKRHWVVRLGRERAAHVYAMMLVFSYVAVVGGVVAGLLPWPVLLVLVTVPLAARAIKVARAYHSVPQALTPANGATIMIHAAVGVLLSAGYALMRIL